MRLYLMVLLPVLGFAEWPPIIDAHVHAQTARGAGPMCPQMDSLPPILRLKDGVSGCVKPLMAASTDLQLMEETLRILREWNIIGVANGAAAHVDRWKAAGGHRIIPALGFALPNGPSLETLRGWFASGRFAVLGEVENQYNGIGPDDPRFEPYLSLAEELDRLPHGFRSSGCALHRDEEVPCPPR